MATLEEINEKLDRIIQEQEEQKDLLDMIAEFLGEKDEEGLEVYEVSFEGK